MNKISVILYIQIFALIISCTNHTNQAKTYNNQIINLHLDINKKIENFIDSFQSVTTNELENKRIQLSTYAEKIVEKAEKIPQIENDMGFKHSSIKLFKFYKLLIDNEFKDLIKLLEREPDIYKIIEIKKIISEKTIIYDEDFRRKQQEFAVQHKLKIIQN